MIYIFIAVLFVLIVMNLFMLFVLRQMAKSTGKQVERDAGRLFGMYDELIEEKSRELLEIQEEKERLLAMEVKTEPGAATLAASGPSFAGLTPPVKESRFQDESFSDAYRRVKREFSFAPEELAGTLKESIRETEGEKKARRVLEELSELLSFDNLCRISALSSEQQEELFSGLLTPEQKEVFEAWKGERTSVDAVAFSDFVKAELAGLDGRMFVQVPGDGRQRGGQAGKEIPADGGQAQDDIIYEESPALCEGARIVYKGRMYDFGI